MSKILKSHSKQTVFSHFWDLLVYEIQRFIKEYKLFCLSIPTNIELCYRLLLSLHKIIAVSVYHSLINSWVVQVVEFSDKFLDICTSVCLNIFHRKLFLLKKVYFSCCCFFIVTYSYQFTIAQSLELKLWSCRKSMTQNIPGKQVLPLLISTGFSKYPLELKKKSVSL